MPNQNSPALDAWVRDYAGRALQPEYVEHWVRRMDDGILARVPALQADALLVEDLDSSSRAHWHAFHQMLVQSESTLVFPEPAAEFARSVARRGHDLATLLKVYRAGNLIVFEHFTELVQDLPADGPRPDETLVFLWTRGGVWLDESMERITEIFYEEQAQAMESRLAEKTETVRVLLEGLPMSEDVSGALGHALSHWQTGFVVWAEPGVSDGSQALQDAARGLAAALGAPRPLTIPRSSRDLWCWAATSSAPDLTSALASWAETAPDGVRMAVGIPAPGTPGFRTSNQEACDAQRLMMSVPEPPAVVRYDEVELLCLATADSESFVRMVRRELGDLAADASGIVQTRETLLCYLTSGANAEAVAKQLFVHRNTVRYRLNRAEELMGHRITERVGHVELALRYISLFGAAAAAHEPTPGAQRPRWRASTASGA